MRLNQYLATEVRIEGTQKVAGSLPYQRIYGIKETIK